MKFQRKNGNSELSCPACLQIREKYHAFGDSMLFVTIVGRGIPSPITIPLMIYADYKASRRFEKCRV